MMNRSKNIYCHNDVVRLIICISLTNRAKMFVKQIDSLNDPENGNDYDEYFFKRSHQIFVLINEN